MTEKGAIDSRHKSPTPKSDPEEPSTSGISNNINAPSDNLADSQNDKKVNALDLPGSNGQTSPRYDSQTVSLNTEQSTCSGGAEDSEEDRKEDGDEDSSADSGGGGVHQIPHTSTATNEFIRSLRAKRLRIVQGLDEVDEDSHNKT